MDSFDGIVLKDRFSRPGTCKKGRLIAGVMNALYPSRCRSCGELFDPCVRLQDANEKGTDGTRWIERTFDRMMRPWVCLTCRTELVPIGSPQCTICGVPFDGVGVDHQCGRCLEKRPIFDQARSVGRYAGSLRKLVHGLKYQRRVELARPLGRLLLSVRRRFGGIGHYDLIIPVPLHSKRMRQRGFNQAALLASSWYPSSSQGDAEVSLPPMVTDIVKRVRHTPSLTGLNRKERRTVIRGAFDVTEPGRIRDRAILLIDDVCTTGATADACAKVLKKHRARRVDLLTLGRA